MISTTRFIGIEGYPSYMARIDLRVGEDLEKQFRAAVYKVHGFKRGSMKAAAEEAIHVWLKKVGEE